MTEHDALFIIKALYDYSYDHVRAGVAERGDECWPTRYQLTENLKLNLAALGSDALQSFGARFPRLKEKGWVVVGGCVPQCHADHVKLTGLGLRALASMNEHGCDVHRAAGRKSPCHAGAALKFNKAA